MTEVWNLSFSDFPFWVPQVTKNSLNLLMISVSVKEFYELDKLHLSMYHNSAMQNRFTILVSHCVLPAEFPPSPYFPTVEATDLFSIIVVCIFQNVTYVELCYSSCGLASLAWNICLIKVHTCFFL